MSQSSFSIEQLSILDEKGNATKKLLPKLSGKELLKMYELMILARKADAKAIHLQRQGRMGTYASLLGQEAAQIGTAFALKKNDWIVQSFRDHGVLLTMGYPIHLTYLYWGGDERGSICPPDLNILPVSVPVGSQALHATGIGFALKLKKSNQVAVGYFGDGSTSEGDVYESLNLAGVFQTNTIFVCQNNQYAISETHDEQTHATTYAQKAIAAGIPGIQVDGNDVLAVYSAMSRAVDRARKRKGPTFIECVTYRLENHTTADDWTRYRTKKEVNAWKRKDPILRLEKYLKSTKILDKKIIITIEKRTEKQVSDAVKLYESIEPPSPDTIFTSLYETMPPDLKAQMEILRS